VLERREWCEIPSASNKAVTYPVIDAATVEAYSDIAAPE